MGEPTFIKGQLLIRSIIEEYRNLLETLSYPQILLKDSNGPHSSRQQRGNHDPRTGETKASTQDILQKLTRLFSQLKTVYSQCLDELKALDNSEIPSLQNTAIAERVCKSELNQDASETSKPQLQDLIQGNRQLKNIKDEMRQMIWDIDIMKKL
eukprot:gene12008-13247_t